MRLMPRGEHTPRIGACAFELSATAGNQVQLLPDGLFRAEDGRPHGLDGWRLDAGIAAGVIARAAARKRDTVIDYEHQTLYGGKAPAAGWFHDLAYRPGEGLFATDVAWTDTARAHIAEREYRYLSAVFTYDPDTGAVLRILHAGLTNDPALDGLQEVELAAAAKYFPEEEPPMKELLKALGLAEDATETQAVEALKSLQGQVQELQATLAGKDQEIAALKREAAATGPDPAKFAPVETVEALKQEIATLKAEQTSREVGELVACALSEGKLLPAQEEWARELGRRDLAALKEYLEKTPAIEALKGGQTGGKAPREGEGEGGLTERQLAICKACGIDPETYAKAAA